MAEFKRNFIGGRMNLDIDERLLKDGEYREARNIEIIHSEGSDVGAIEKPKSNKKVTNFNFTKGITIGRFEDEFEDKIYWFVVDDNGCYLCEYDKTNQISTYILKETRPEGERVLDLKVDKLITSIVKVTDEETKKDLLLVTDYNIEPLCINIERAKTYGENGFEREDIYLIKKPPRFAPNTQLTYIDTESNYIKDNFFSFAYRYKYLDGEFSALSSYTNYQFSPGQFELDYQTMENIGMQNSFNGIRIGFDTGDKRVTDIQLVFKKSNSNNLEIIETFNKELSGWDDNEEKWFTFSNNKKYIVLPEKELYRSFDNVPRKAQTVTLIDNYPVFGNYIEGFNIEDVDGNKIQIDYLLNLISNDLSGGELNTSLGTNTITFDIGDNELNSGTKLIFDIKLNEDDSEEQDGSYEGSLEFILNEDYADMNELANSSDFELFINTIMTNNFSSNYDITPPADVVETTINGFVIAESTATTITLQAPIVTTVSDNTPADITDDDTTTLSVNFAFMGGTNIYFKKFDVNTSIKTNRSCEVGIIYSGDFGRKTVVLTTPYNTIDIPHKYSTFQNKIQVDLINKPPYWADTYKFVVKQNKGDYHTLYTTIFYEDGLYRWVLLEGTNKDKVKVGDTLIVKSDLDGVVDDVIEITVLDIVEKDKDFIEGNVNTEGEEIIELKGTYMKIKPIGINMDISESVYFNYYQSKKAKSGQPSVNIGSGGIAFSGTSINDFAITTLEGTLVGYKDSTTNLYVDFAISKGTQIHLKFLNTESDGYRKEYEKDFVVDGDYTNFQEWWEAEVVDLGSSEEDFDWEFKRNDDNSLWLWVEGNESGTRFERSKLYCYVDVILADGVLIFETKPDDIEEDIYYETEQTFEIIDNKHQGNIQNQTDTENAIIELDYFNCYVQGNGAESYIIKDTFNKNSLNIDLRPSTTIVEEYKEVRNFAGIIHGEQYNGSLNVNGLNEFNPSLQNYKLLDMQYGSIQKIVSRETDLIIFQEDKVGSVLFNKRSMKNADGTENVVISDLVFGNFKPYVGENGVAKNPESISVWKNAMYWINVKRGTPFRLSNNGATEINYGTIDYFRDLCLNNPTSKKITGFDPHTNKLYLTSETESKKVYVANCGDTIYKNTTSESFTYNLQLNDLLGDITIPYSIDGSANITTNYNGVVVNNNGLTGFGQLIINRTDLLSNYIKITVTPIGEIDFEVSNLCPIGTELKVVSIVLGDDSDIGTTMTNRYKANGTYYSDELLFSINGVNQFSESTGTEGVGKFPINNSVVEIQSVKDNYNNGNFDKDKCNRLGYLITSTVYTESDIDTIKGLATYLMVTSNGSNNELNSGSFTFNRSANEILYLLWDYSDKKPIANDDYISTQQGTSITFDVTNNDDDTNNIGLQSPTIVTQPINGTVVVNPDDTITYTHNGGDTLNDSFTYTISNGECTSDIATVNIDIGVSCNDSFSYNGDSTPFEVQVVFGTEIGECGIAYEAFNIPDQFEIFYDGNLVATTGGLVSGNDTLTFNKTTEHPTVATIKVTPNTNTGTAWNFTGICPNVEVASRQAFLDTENTTKNLSE